MSRGKGKRYKEEEIVRILKEAEMGLPVVDLLRKHKRFEDAKTQN
jgi:hypothetical protein